MPKWSEQESFKFVSLYRDNECLWNVIHPSYKIRQKRVEAFKRIASAMGMPDFTPDDVPKKIKSFRSTYGQELVKIEKSTETENLYTPSVKWFHDMDYVMRNSNQSERQATTNSDDIEPNVNYCYVTTETDDFSLESPATYENLLPVAPYEYEPSTTTASRSKKRPRLKNNPPEDPEASRTAEVQETIMEDECDIIGRLVAMQLRKLPPDDMVDANLEIQHVLAKYKKKQTQSGSVDSSMPLQ